MQLSPSTQQVKPKIAKRIAVRSETRAFIETCPDGRRGIVSWSRSLSRGFRIDDLARGILKGDKFTLTPESSFNYFGGAVVANSTPNPHDRTIKPNEISQYLQERFHDFQD
jgi:hypothetical protein